MDVTLSTSSIRTVTAAVALVVLVPVLRTLYRWLVKPHLSLRNVPGPPIDNLIFGNLKQIFNEDPAVPQERWYAQYGPVFKYKAFFGNNRLVTMDLRAVSHILSHSFIYQKPDMARFNLSQLLGHGLLSVEGEKHKQQRRIMSPAFGPPQIRALTSIFVEKANQLRDIWLSNIASQNADPGTLEQSKINVLPWLNKATLDVIGLAGFNYSFDALNPDDVPNELNESVKILFSSMRGFRLFPALQALIPPLRLIPTERTRLLANAQQTMSRIGKQLLAEQKAEIKAQATGEGGGTTIGRKDIQGKDLLSLLVKANMAGDLKEELRMNDFDVLAQVPTFLIAGHETTSAAVTWALYALSLYPEVQDKLRAELLAAQPPPSADHDGDDGVTMEFLSSLPYLDAVTRETMRVFSPVSGTIRVATEDDVIPTAREWVDKHGVRQNSIHISKGDTIFLPILAINRLEDIWGPDAKEFKPERWEKIPSAVEDIPGIWGNSLSFSGGTRACIGYRFSVIEMKALIYTLVRSFRFSLAFEPSSLKFKSFLVTKPFLADELDAGPQLPLWVSPLKDGGEC